MGITPNKSPSAGKKKPKTKPTNTSKNDSDSRPSTGTEKSGAWSNEEITTLVNMVKDGKGAAEIAKALNRKEASVTYQRYGLRVRSRLKVAATPARIPLGPNPLAADILNLTGRTCRWPEENGFCKERTGGIEESYCAVHKKKSLQAYTKPLNMNGIPS